jgi:hypothetical protein
MLLVILTALPAADLLWLQAWLNTGLIEVRSMA